MPSHSTERKQRQRLARLQKLSTLEGRKRRGIQLLMDWRREARRRARLLGAPAAWALANYPSVRALAHEVDPSGELLSELRHVCAEAVADFAGRHLLGNSRPVADRVRRVKITHPDTSVAIPPLQSRQKCVPKKNEEDVQDVV